MTNSHSVGTQSEFNVLIPRAINTVTLCKTTSLTPNLEPERKSWVALVGFVVSTLSCPRGGVGRGGGGYMLIQLTEASECRRSTDEIPVSLCSQEERRGSSQSPQQKGAGASKYPPRAERVRAPTSSIALLGRRREQ